MHHRKITRQKTLINPVLGVPSVVQGVRDLALSLLWLWLQLWHRLNPWPGNFCMQEAQPHFFFLIKIKTYPKTVISKEITVVTYLNKQAVLVLKESIV